MLNYEGIKKLYDPFKSPDVNLLFAVALLKKSAKNKVKFPNAMEIMKSITDKRYTEELALYQIRNPQDKISIVVFREFISGKFL